MIKLLRLIQIIRMQKSFTPTSNIQSLLSSSYDEIILSQQTNILLQDLTYNFAFDKNIKQSLQSPLIPSSQLTKILFQQNCSLIMNQTGFVGYLLKNYYLEKMPQNVQQDIGKVFIVGIGFQTSWWTTLALIMIKGWNNRNKETTKTEKLTKVLGIGALFILSSMGFHQFYYQPKLQSTYFKHLKYIDAMMIRHAQILKRAGANLQIKRQSNQANY